MIRILAVDPGFCHTGIVAMELQSGVWRPVLLETVTTEPPKEKSKLLKGDCDFARLLMTADRMLAEAPKARGLLAELPPGGAKSAAAQRAMALASGLLAGLVASLRLPYELVQPGDVKKSVTGKRSASKEEIMDWAGRQWPEETARFASKRAASGWTAEFEHVADALAVFETCRNGNLVRMLESFEAEGKQAGG
jgi:Holliday junction resolvasome RuvABC endonuclease subunit